MTTAPFIPPYAPFDEHSSIEEALVLPCTDKWLDAFSGVEKGWIIIDFCDSQSDVDEVAVDSGGWMQKLRPLGSHNSWQESSCLYFGGVLRVYWRNGDCMFLLLFNTNSTEAIILEMTCF